MPIQTPAPMPSLYVYSTQILPSMDSYYRWNGWSTAAVNLNNIYFVDLNKDNRLDLVLDFWQNVSIWGAATDAPTPNRLVLLESQADGTYKDTTATRFGTNNPVVLGDKLGGVGVADFGDINRDGTLDMIFALNRDDGRLGTQTSGDSYPTAIMSTPNGQYEIQKISTPVWSYFAQLVDLGDTSQAWFNQIGYYASTRTYGLGVAGSVDGQPVYSYDSSTKAWRVSGQPPVSGSFSVLPEQVKNGKVEQALVMLWDSSTTIDPAMTIPGASFRVPKPALMQQTAAGDWTVLSVANPFGYQPESFTFNGYKQSGMVAHDGTHHFALVEYFYRPGSFELFPGSLPVVMATRSMVLLDKDAASGTYTGSANATKMDFFGVSNSALEKLPIKIVNEQLDLASWSYRYLDFNNDGLTDILAEGWHANLGPQDPSSGAPAIYLNTGAGVFVHLSEDLFPRAPEGWSRYSMSQVLDANGDGIYDLVYFPAIANGQFIPNLDWRLYLGTTSQLNSVYNNPIQISDRIHTSLIKTQAGNDLIQDINASAATQIDGGLGIDTVQYSGKLATYQIAKVGSSWRITANGTQPLNDTLTQVERLQFADGMRAIDLDGNAGIVAKTLGAVFGKSAIANKEYAGIGLHFVDTLHYNYADLMQLAITAKLGTTPTSAQVVDLLYTNVVGQAPDATTQKIFADLLDNHTYTVGSLGVLAADTDLNKVNINLIGLNQSGLEYLSFFKA